MGWGSGGRCGFVNVIDCMHIFFVYVLQKTLGMIGFLSSITSKSCKLFAV